MKVRAIGQVAGEIIEQEQEFRLLGISSRGLFMTCSARVLFLSNEAYRGPLTLNLEGGSKEIQEQVGNTVRIQPERIWFPGSGLQISIAGAEVWSPAPRGRDILSEGDLRARFDEVAQFLPPGDPVSAVESSAQIVQALQGDQIGRLVDLLLPLLGRGPGLTPAGDDFVLGFLLTLHRWGQAVHPDFPFEVLSARIIPEAKSRTTTLSANLIECAARGQADERLIAGLDGLASGSPEADACAEYFRSAFEGMKMAFGMNAT